MQRCATKDHYEREQEETERLVRPAPKDKPPRRDLRRERVEPDSDSDSGDASDRKDRSQNFKDIGGSERVATDKVPAKNRETGKTVYVSPETLREEGGKYEALDPEEAGSAVSEPDDKAYGVKGDALHQLAKTDPKLKSKLKDFSNPESHLWGFVKENPSYPAAKLFPGVDLPEGLNTLGDVKRALQNAGKAAPAEPEGKPKGKKKTNPPESQEQAKPEQSGSSTEKKEEPASEEESDEEPSKPATPRVKRRPVTSAERLEAASLVTDTFPPEDAAKVLAQEDLHPDDVKVLVRDYLSAKESRRGGDLPSFVKRVSGFYVEDFGSVQPPVKGRNAAGAVVPFEKLSEEEKAEATLEHQLQVMAMSLAARDIVKTRLMDVGVLTGKPRIPSEIASKIADSMFRPASEDLGVTSFDEFLKTGSETKISETTAKSLIDRVEGNVGGTLVAKAFLQANDYGLAKARFLRGDDESISEWQKPKDIVKGLGRVGKFFAERNSWYGGGDHPAAGFFRMKVLQRLKALDPKKASQVVEELPDLEQEEYDMLYEQWKRAHDAWAEAKEKFEAAGKGEFAEAEPVKPTPPVGRPDKAAGRRLWKRMVSESKGLSKKSNDFTYSFGPVMDSKTAVYNGVDPYAYGPAEYTKWKQPHQRDIDGTAEQSILTSAREWLKSPLLTVSVEGMVPDARYRAALDLAITSGPYQGQIQANLYNSLLARLAGVSQSEGDTLTTIREASTAYGLSTQEWFLEGSKVAQEVVAKAVEKISLSYSDFEGVPQSNGFATIRKFEASSMILDFPKGSGVELYRALQASLSELGVQVRPKVREASTDVAEGIRQFAARVADDRVAIEMAAFAASLPDPTAANVKTGSDKYAKLKSGIVSYAHSLNASKRSHVLPILKLLKDLG